MEPELVRFDKLLENDVFFGRIGADLSQHYSDSSTHGRPATPVEVILRMPVVKRLYGRSYEQTERFVSDSLVLGDFAASTSTRLPTIPPSSGGRTRSVLARS